MTNRLSFAALMLLLVATVPRAWAVETPMLHMDTTPCDPLFIPQLVDELGLMPPFPMDEGLSSVATLLQEPACPPFDDPSLPNARVSITNLTVPPRAFTDVWYVKDRETSLTNPDGMAAMPGVPLELAFKIDTVGINKPLISESMAFDGVWAPGETWDFIIQDYMNSLGMPPSAIDSIGVPSTASPPSSGSIIAVPEPMSTIGLPVVAWLVMRRRCRRMS